MDAKILTNGLYDNMLAMGIGGGITFFTPTYNRAQFLKRVYDCLLQQTNNLFCWIVVNDGSTDETDEIMRHILDENDLPICYISKNNGGKHSAFKYALEQCQTELFQCLDDDDLYDKESVAFFVDAWKRVKLETRHDIGAIRTLTRRKDGSFMANPDIKPDEMGHYYDVTTLEMNYIFHRYQENWTCYNTEKLRTIDLFDKDYWLSDKHKFFQESIWQGRFARRYKCRYYNVAFREYSTEAGTSILRGKKTRQHYIDMFINTYIANNEQYDFISRSFPRLLSNIVLVSMLRGFLNIKICEVVHHSANIHLKLLYTLFYPLGIVGKFVVRRKVE